MKPLSEVDLDAYLLDADGQPWGQWLEPFAPPLPAQFDLFLITRFLDFFLVYPDGSVNWLETQAGRLTQVAPSRAEFEAAMESEYPHWLMVGAVDAAAAAGRRLGVGQCYAYKVPPMLGGAYDLDNVEIGDVEASMRVLGQIFAQAKALPPGVRVRVGTSR